MNIAIALDNVIRDVQSFWQEFIQTHNWNIQSGFSKEWLDYKSLISPYKEAEDKINKWFDQGYKILIITKNDEYNRIWLNNHYIPYDKIIEYPENEINIWIDCNLENCLEITKFKSITKSYYFNNSVNPTLYSLSSDIDFSKIVTVKSWNDIIL